MAPPFSGRLESGSLFTPLAPLGERVAEGRVRGPSFPSREGWSRESGRTDQRLRTPCLQKEKPYCQGSALLVFSGFLNPGLKPWAAMIVAAPPLPEWSGIPLALPGERVAEGRVRGPSFPSWEGWREATGWSAGSTSSRLPTKRSMPSRTRSVFIASWNPEPPRPLPRHPSTEGNKTTSPPRRSPSPSPGAEPHPTFG